MQIWYLAGILPDGVATKFGWDGHANNWSSKTVFLWLEFFTMTVMFGMFYIFSRWMNKVPDSQINIPYKHYWLAPERRNKTIGYVGSQLDFLGVCALAFMLYTFEELGRANLMNPPKISGNYMYIVGSFVILILVWSYLFIRHFYKVPKQLKIQK